MEIKSDVAVIF